jgi:CRP/FNR family transcriptional regulator
VEKGSVCLYRTLPDGRRQIFGFAYAGDFVALDCTDAHSHNAQSLTLTRVRCLPAHVLKEVGRSDPEAGMQLYTTLSEQLMAARDLVSTVGQRSAAERLAGLLLALARRNERNGLDPWRIQLPMTRLDIADLLSLTIETVSRTFTKFRHDRLIELTHSTLVTVLDPQELESLAAGER